jgi:hypothetical protein
MPLTASGGPSPRLALARAVAPAGRGIALAASGFLAGAAVVGLVGRRRAYGSRSLGRVARGARAGAGGSRRGRGRGVEPVQIVGTRSLLLDIHLLGRPER